MKRFRVAVGKRGFQTPAGDHRIVSLQANPTWFPPDRRWARGFGPIPLGPENPLGTRWMGLSLPGIGIHGTPVPSSVGTAASHGCIRMRIPDAERVFAEVRLGTRVYVR